MLPEERLGLACLSYQRALVAARRSAPSSTSWRRLLTAARNVAEARRDRERSGGRARAAAPASAPHLGRVLPFRVDASRSRTLKIWAELNREWERSRALMAQARALLDAARRRS